MCRKAVKSIQSVLGSGCLCQPRKVLHLRSMGLFSFSVEMLICYLKNCRGSCALVNMYSTKIKSSSLIIGCLVGLGLL